MTEPAGTTVERSARVINERYVLHDVIAAGGMATVHFGRLLGAAGFARTVAIKRLHQHLACDAELAAMLLDEARIAARIRHPNVVATLDTVAADGELLVVMEFVLGESLSRLVRRLRLRGESLPTNMAVAIGVGVLHGLHAAHEATGEEGEPLGVVHRDVSPQNVLVGADGLARVLDFGVAKALGRCQTTRHGQLKGKTAYMAPEQVRGLEVDRRTDVYAAAVVVWEMLTGRRLFVGDSPGEIMARVLEQPIERPSDIVGSIPKELDDVVLRGLQRDPRERFATAEDMALALETALAVPNQGTVSRWVKEVLAEPLSEQSAMLLQLESGTVVDQERTVIRPVVPEEAVESQVSSISVTTAASTDPIAHRGSRKRRRILLTAVAIVGALAMGAMILRLRTATDHVNMTPTTGREAGAPEPRPAISPEVAASPHAPGGVSVAGAATPSVSVTAPPKRLPSHPPKLPGKPLCSPPYVIDSEGVHVPKKECL